MKKILINDILHLSEDEISSTRVKLNVDDGYNDPLELFETNPERVNTKWFLWHKDRRHFHAGYIAICLVYFHNDEWLLTTIKKITKELDVSDDIGYEATEMNEYSQFFGRLVLKYHNSSRSMVRTYESLLNDLEVLKILPNVYDGQDFPGYENVRLSYRQLASILERKKIGWITALQNQKAVYLITDTSNGKLYVGSATGEDMLLQRWASYVENGHGGNSDFKKLVDREGFEYVKKNFQYLILENYNARTDNDYILQREAWWKSTLCSKEFGYNNN